MGNPSVKNGLMGAGVAIIIYLILWLIDPTSYLKFGSWIGLVIALFLCIGLQKKHVTLTEVLLNLLNFSK